MEIFRTDHHNTIELSRPLFLIVLFLMAISVSLTYSAAVGQQKRVVNNVRFTIYGSLVTINYDLQGDPEARYSVSLILRKESDSTFRYSPKELTGDIGLGKYAGRGKKIVWDISDEFPQGLQGSDFYFVVNAKEVEGRSSTGILTWIGAGAAVIVATVTYIIVTRNRGGSGVTPSYPIPPGRPK